MTMPHDIERAVTAIHAAPHRLVYVFAGAGALALHWLHAVAGSSRTILEARDCYSAASLAEVMQGVPPQFVRPTVAAGMAVWAAHRAVALATGDWPLLGVACTAAIATDRVRSGADRAFIAVVRPPAGPHAGPAWPDTPSGIELPDTPSGLELPGTPRIVALTLDRAAGRAAQEEQVSRRVIEAIARACGADLDPAQPGT